MFESTVGDNNKIGFADRTGYFLSSVIGILAPGIQLQMDAARRMKSHIKSSNALDSWRSYDSAGTNRFNKNRVVTDGTANAELLNSNALSTIRKNTRDTMRNSPIGKAAKRALTAWIVGKGVTVQSQATDRDGKPLSEFNRKIERLWRVWAGSGKQCDVRGKKTFNRFLGQGIGQLAEGGEYILNKTARFRTGDLLSLKLESIENDLLDDKLNSSSIINSSPVKTSALAEGIIGGIEIDKYGSPLYYNFLKFNGNNSTIVPVDYHRIKADQIIHAYFEDRPGQLRGEPWFASCLGYLQSANRAVQAELFSLEVQACFAVVYKSGTGGAKKWLGAEAAGASAKIDENNNRIRKLSPGGIVEIPGADNINIVDPKRPGQTFQIYIKFILKLIAAALGISYSKLAKDYADGNFSSKRMEDRDEIGRASCRERV